MIHISPQLLGMADIYYYPPSFYLSPLQNDVFVRAAAIA